MISPRRGDHDDVRQAQCDLLGGVFGLYADGLMPNRHPRTVLDIHCTACNAIIDCGEMERPGVGRGL